MSVKTKFPTLRPTLNLDFANTKQLDSRITFTRASTATYWDGKTFAKAEENLLKYSQEFDNAAWGKTSVTVTANTTTAPDGTTTADSLVTANGSSGIWYLQQIPAVAAPTMFSIYAKANTANHLGVALGNAGVLAGVDLSTGTVTLQGSGYVVTTASIGGGWYRVTVAVAGGSDRVRIFASTTSITVDNQSVTGDGISGIYIWGAQLEQRSQATAYTPTTDQPITKYQPVLQNAASGAARFDHNPVTGESLGLLIEEQRTNLLTYSSDFDNAAWEKTNATVAANTATAPDGTLTADKVTPNTAANQHSLSCSNIPAGTYTWSAYFKAAGYTKAAITCYDGTSYKAGSVFDLSAGAVLVSAADSTSKIESVGNGWYRCSVSATLAAASQFGGGGFRPNIGGINASESVAGDGTSGIYIWGAQLEAGAFPTSYIPTTTAQVTRAADAATMTGANFSSWYRQDEGTLFAEALDPVLPTVSRVIVEVGDGTEANRFSIESRSQDADMVGFVGISKSSITTNIQATGLGDGRVKTAFALGPLLSGGVIGCADGNFTPSVADPIIPMPLSSLRIGATSIGVAVWNGQIKKLAYYPKRLSNAELQALTS